MMNEGVVQSSPVQRMVAAGGHKWGCINNMGPPPHHQHHTLMAAPPQNHDFPQQLMPPLVAPPASSWIDCQELLSAESWSQVVLGGMVGEEDYKGGIKLEQHRLNQSSDTCAAPPVIKQESGTTNYGPAGIDDEFQAPKSTNSWSESSHNSCVATLSTNILNFSRKSSRCNSSGSTGGAAKKARIQTSSSTQSAIKVRKEKLGDRITALHQLVSPFGKTDTASVLLEAMGYIRFLERQIEALSLPCLGSNPSGNIRRQQPERDEEPKKDLKSRGLCLVPISCTSDVGSENGGDYWAPAFGTNFQ